MDGRDRVAHESRLSDPATASSSVHKSVSADCFVLIQHGAPEQMLASAVKSGNGISGWQHNECQHDWRGNGASIRVCGPDGDLSQTWVSG